VRDILARVVDHLSELTKDRPLRFARLPEGVEGIRGHLKVCALNNANSDKMRTCDHLTERQISVPAAQHIVRFLGYY
jgi:hypothetical protein